MEDIYKMTDDELRNYAFSLHKTASGKDSVRFRPEAMEELIRRCGLMFPRMMFDETDERGDYLSNFGVATHIANLLCFILRVDSATWGD